MADGASMVSTDDPNKEISVTYTYDANGLRTGMTVTTRTYHSHSYTSVVTQPTCTTRGYTTYTCACGDSYTDSQTAATGHRNTSTVIMEPTCTQRGVIRHTCTVCGNVSATYSPALGHVPGTGINRLRCDRCGETIGSGGGGGGITPVDPPITPIDPTVPIQSTETGTMETQSTDNSDDRILVSEQTVEYEYFYTGDKLTYMTQTTQVNQGAAETEDIWFYYDAAGTPYALKYQDEYFYYATNAQGDVTAILNSSGNTVATYSYDAWGNPLATTGTHALANLNPLRYRGYVYDNETELYYLQSRYYNPEVGRFLNADAYAATGQGLLGNNMFAYCVNNPVSYVDIHGNSPRDVFAICYGEAGTYKTVCSTDGNEMSENLLQLVLEKYIPVRDKTIYISVMQDETYSKYTDYTGDVVFTGLGVISTAVSFVSTAPAIITFLASVAGVCSTAYGVGSLASKMRSPLPDKDYYRFHVTMSWNETFSPEGYPDVLISNTYVVHLSFLWNDVRYDSCDWFLEGFEWDVK